MESLETLTGGVVHKINNVLGGVIGYSELLMDELLESSPLRIYAESIIQFSVRGAAKSFRIFRL
jgi:two-component system cell cycle sensor histidine kinase/response regulator CckA